MASGKTTEDREQSTPTLSGESMETLPLPRLQLTWTRTGKGCWECSYDLFIPIGENDCRGESDGGGPGYTTAHFNTTEASGGGASPVCPGGSLRSPYRDGAHIKWDAKRLGLPAFVVYNRKVNPIIPKN